MALILTLRGTGAAPAALAAPFRIEAGSAVIGRGEDADLRLSHPLVSSRHCMIMGQGGAWQLQDSSTNGTEINGRRIHGQQPLQHGDVIKIADLELMVAVEAGSGAAWNSARGAIPNDWRQGGARAAAEPTSSPASRQQQASRPMQPAGLPDSVNGTPGSADAALQAAITGLTQLARSRAKARQDLKLSDVAAAANPILSGDPAAAAKLMALSPGAAADMVNAACRQLEAHQRASLGAMQTAFKAALDQFAPDAIKLRARDDASAWKSYEKAFRAQDGFVELFAQEFAKAYEQQSRG